jgi:hypothetical protein
MGLMISKNVLMITLFMYLLAIVPPQICPCKIEEVLWLPNLEQNSFRDLWNLCCYQTNPTSHVRSRTWPSLDSQTLPDTDRPNDLHHVRPEIDKKT